MFNMEMQKIALLSIYVYIQSLARQSEDISRILINFAGDADDVVARISANLETSDVASNFRNSTVEYVPRHSRRITF